MLKIFVTGDNHFGKKYNRYPEIKDKLIQSRFDCFQDMVRKAEEEACELFVVTGDLFDNINTIKISDVKQVVDILAKFNGTVLVLPGNHDYYTGEEKVWKDFETILTTQDHNIILLKEFKKYKFDIAEEEVIIYPAFCQSKHSEKNNLDWIKKEEISPDIINIGIAHGAIQGITPDMNGEYFLMTENELLNIPVDLWLIGHTHISYPQNLSEESYIEGYKIFNAGTHEQTDLHNNTDGNAFIISIEKKDKNAVVLAKKYVSGKIHFRDIQIEVTPQSDTALIDELNNVLKDIDKNTVVRVKINGSIRQEEYQKKEMIYKQLLGNFLSYEIIDSELSEEITIEKIRTEYAQTSFAAKFMENLIENPIELQMAYQLLQSCKNE